MERQHAISRPRAVFRAGAPRPNGGKRTYQIRRLHRGYRGEEGPHRPPLSWSASRAPPPCVSKAPKQHSGKTETEWFAAVHHGEGDDLLLRKRPAGNSSWTCATKAGAPPTISSDPPALTEDILTGNFLSSARHAPFATVSVRGTYGRESSIIAED